MLNKLCHLTARKDESKQPADGARKGSGEYTRGISGEGHMGSMEPNTARTPTSEHGGVVLLLGRRNYRLCLLDRVPESTPSSQSSRRDPPFPTDVCVCVRSFARSLKLQQSSVSTLVGKSQDQGRNALTAHVPRKGRSLPTLPAPTPSSSHFATAEAKERLQRWRLSNQHRPTCCKSGSPVDQAASWGRQVSKGEPGMAKTL